MTAFAIIVLLANLLALTGHAAAGGVTDRLLPSAGGTPPAGCVLTFPGRFQITPLDVLASGGISRRALACSGPNTLVVTLNDGVMLDAKGWTAYIASNYQLQFDNPPQAGAMVTAGFSICPASGFLALGGTTTFFQCASGTFGNLYDRNWAPQCREVRLLAMPCGEGAGKVGNGGNVVGTTMVHTTIITVLEDGQPQVVTTLLPVPMCQIGDGQIQVHTTPCDEIPPTTTYVPISQLPDGQVQAPPPASPPGGAPPASPASPTTTPTPPVISPPSNTTVPTSGTPVSPPVATSAPPATPPPAPPASSTTLLLSGAPAQAAAIDRGSSLIALAAGVLGIFAWM